MKRTVLFTIFTLLCAGSAYAAGFGEIRYPDRTLNLRDGRSPRAEWVGALQAGQPVRIAYLKDGWVAVFESYMKNRDSVRIAGYANIKYLKKKRGKVEQKEWGAVMHPRTIVNIRGKRSARSAKLGSLLPGHNVRVDFPEDGWVGVMDNRATIRSKLNVRGFVNSKFMLPGPAPEDAPAEGKEVATTSPASGDVQIRGVAAPVPEEKKVKQDNPVSIPMSSDQSKDGQIDKQEQPAVAPKPWGTVLIAKHALRIRKERSTGSRFVKTVKPGDRVKIDFLKKGWFAVFAPDATVRLEKRAMGYVQASQLKEPAEANSEVGTSSFQDKEVKEGKGTKHNPIIIKPDSSVSSSRPAPKADKYLHGVHYKLLEKSETSREGIETVDIKVFVDVKQLPKASILEDFSKSLWKEHRRSGKLLVVHLYLPQMDLDDISFIEAVYSYEEPLEFWARRTALYGTRFMD